MQQAIPNYHTRIQKGGAILDDVRLLVRSWTNGMYGAAPFPNAWDAEATVVKITLPDILKETPIVVSDNGSGMKEQEMRQEYLNIANPRSSRKGEKTPNLQRPVKGRRGIGKFAGLILAGQMEVDTKAQGTRTRLVISKNALLNAGKDIEQVPLPELVAKTASQNETADSHNQLVLNMF